MKTPALPLLALLSLSPAVLADTIVRADGKVLEDVTIVAETLTQVEYKKGSNTQFVKSEDVLSVSFERSPRLVDEALGLLAEGDVISALEGLDDYVAGQIERPNERRYKWAPAFAAWKVVELRMQVADVLGARGAATRLIKNFPDSRYLPMAYLARAEAELMAQKESDAKKTLENFSSLIRSKNLSKRWDLECRLALIQADSGRSGDAKRTDLAGIAREAGSEFPGVTSRAQVVEGETWLAEAEASRDPNAARDLRSKARRAFEAIVDDPNASDATLAGALAGMGDCLFYEGAEKNDTETLQAAVKNYLRVVTIYEEQTRYVPKSLFFAMRSFDLMQDRRRKSDMKRELKTLFPGSHWASEADKF